MSHIPMPHSSIIMAHSYLSICLIPTRHLKICPIIPILNPNTHALPQTLLYLIPIPYPNTCTPSNTLPTSPIPSPSIPHPNTCPIFHIQHMFYFPTPVSPTTTHTLVPFVLHLHAIHSRTCPIPTAPNPIYMLYSSILLSPSSIPHSNQHISHSPNPTHALFHHPL